jgi:hypothetical protein
MVERARSRRLNGNAHANGGDREEMAANDLVDSTARGPEPTADQWAEAITASWQQAVASILRTGRLLIEAKAALRAEVGHGAWLKMVKDKLPFKQRTADYLMEIARHPVLGNSQYIANLPPSWATLLKLCSLPDDVIKEMIADERIKPEMTGADAEQLIKEHREAGLYKFEDLVAALNTINKFRKRWQDVAELAGHLDFEREGTPDPDDLPPVAEWITALHAGLAAEQRRLEQISDEEEEAERAEIDSRIAPMTDAELKAFAGDDKNTLTERSRARAEAKRRNLPWHSQQWQHGEGVA